MSANASEKMAATPPVAKQAPTEQQESQPGVPKKIVNAQTVCNEKNEKGKLCNGHLKQLKTGGEPAEAHLRGNDVLFKCQTCGTLYMGPPLGHLRDPRHSCPAGWRRYHMRRSLPGRAATYAGPPDG